MCCLRMRGLACAVSWYTRASYSVWYSSAHLQVNNYVKIYLNILSMNTELNALKDLVLTIIKKQEKVETLTLLSLEAERLPDAIIAHTLRLSTDKQVQNYINWQQEQLIKEANLLYKCCLDMPRRIVQKGLVHILHILKVLNSMFPIEFDNILPLPKVAYLKIRPHYQTVFQQLSVNFQDNDISEQLLGIALYPLTWFLNSTLPARYCDEYFLSAYTTILLDTNLNDLNPAAAEELLCSRLLTVNYNGLAFMDYLCNKVKMDLDAAVLKKDKELVLKRIKIWLKPIPVRLKLAFDKNFASLKEALLEWAALEEDALALLPDEVKKLRAVSEQEPLKLGLSVAVLAFLTRLYKIHQLFPGKKHSEIVDHMVITYSTKQTTRISRDSFYNSYKAPTNGVARALRKLLRVLLEDVEYFINTGTVREDKV
jgi:hypothetical protein